MTRSALLAALIALTLTACGEKAAEEAVATPEEMTEAAVEEAPVVEEAPASEAVVEEAPAAEEVPAAE